MQRLIADVQNDLNGRNLQLAYYDAVNEGALQANALLQQASPDPRALVIAAYRATEYSYIATTRATWDEVVSSGDVGLLPSAAVRPLNVYYSIDLGLDAGETFRASPYRLRVRRLVSFEVQNAIREGCSDRLDSASLVAGFVAQCELRDVSDAQIAEAAQALRRDPEVLADLRSQLSELAGTRGDFGRDIRRLQDALAALQAAE